ncbi:MAG: 4-hydroxybenzoate octaprenyltransferase [Spirochaetes bacterium]|nr:MAG: 4-hydroxybenzoate octaprenyltransferase [Spirochaetota bacterium]
MDFKKFSELIMIEQTLFALPFAYLGILFAGGGDFITWIWATIALFAARTAGMSFNRYIDRVIDAKNPRTSGRALPAGAMKPGDVLMLGVGSSALLVVSALMLNSLCFYLSFPAIVLLYTYSYFKRFTSASHFYLGIVEAAAPVGGYLAVTGEFDMLPFILGAVILFWIAGLDVVYAILDVDFDRKEGLFSIPARLGKEKALAISIACYVLATGLLALAGFMTARGIPYWAAVFSTAIIFYRQQSLARHDDPAAAIHEFFLLNRFVSPVLFAGTFVDVFFK